MHVKNRGEYMAHTPCYVLKKGKRQKQVYWLRVKEGATMLA